MYVSQNFYLLRRPNKSVDDILSISESISKSGQKEFEERIVKSFSSVDNQEAIYLASPNLYRQLKKWQQGEKLSEERRNKLLLSLYKYLKRMSIRCTPFGLFAGYANGSISDIETDIVFVAQDESYIQKQIHLDMNCVAEVIEDLLKKPIIRNQLVFYPNNSLYRIGNTWRYVEYVIKNKRKSYTIASVTNTAILQKVLSFAEPGKKIGEMINILIEEGVCNEDDATQFINQIIDKQMLISELALSITGTAHFTRLIHRLKTIKGTEQYTNSLSIVDKLLNKPNISIKDYFDIKAIITKKIPSTNIKNLVQVNTFYRTKQNNLKKSSVNLIVKNLNRLTCLYRNTVHYNLASFREKFISKYETQEVPLSIALDSEVGIGYGFNVSGTSDFMPLLKGVTLPSTPIAPSFSWDELTRLKYKLVTKAKEEKKNVVLIRDSDLYELSSRDNFSKPLPKSAYAAGTILASSPKHFDQKDFKFFLAAFMGPSAANLLGRFAQNNTILTKSLQDCLQEEERTDPDTIYAEIVHIPEARVANILARPNLRNYEIPYLGNATVPRSNQIPLNDLMVSVRGDKVILRSIKHGKKVIPRLSTAHNYHRGLPTYQFLCDLQFQEQELRVFWNWFPFDQEETFLPRVEYQNIILYRAQWRFKRDQYQEVMKKDTNIIKFFNELRQHWQIPRYTVAQQGDKELFIDFDNPYCLQHLRQIFKKRDLILSEFLSIPDYCMIEVNEKKYAHEVILPLNYTDTKTEHSSPSFVDHSLSVKRNFPIGSSWLYTKIYTGNKAGDTVLTDTILPLTQELLQKGIVDKWFFIRYKDPEPHLRIRFHNGSQPDFWKETLEQLNEKLEPLTKEGIISKIVVDTYQRELERYGAHTMTLSEDFFYADSIAIVKMLKAIRGGKCEHNRWLFALKNIDILLTDFLFTLEEKSELLNRLQTKFYKEFDRGSTKSKLKYSLDQKYRDNMKDIENIMSTNPENCKLEIVNCFRERSHKNQSIIHAIQEKNKQGLGKKIEELAPSYVHMTLNRTFIAKRRIHELIIYHYLSKYYNSQIARRRNRKGTTNSRVVHKEVVQ